MPSATNIQGQIHVDRYLTNYSVQYVQDEKNFLGQRAATVIPVLKQTDKYVTYDKGFFWRDEVKVRPLTGRPIQIGYKVESDSYTCEEYAAEHLVDDRQRANVDEPIKLDENAVRLLTDKHMIKQDLTWASSFFVPSAWTTEYTGVVSGPTATQFVQFNDASSDPIGTIDQAKDAMHEITGKWPNTLVLGTDVKRELRSHPDITDRIKYTQIGIADEDLLASLFEVDTLIVARAIYNAAAEGVANDLQYITDKRAMWLGYIAPTPTLDAPTAIANFSWTGLLPGTNALGGVIERGREERAHSDWFQMRTAWGLKQVAADLGVFFGEAVAA